MFNSEYYFLLNKVNLHSMFLFRQRDSCSPLYQLLPKVQQVNAHFLCHMLKQFDRAHKPLDSIRSSIFIRISKQLPSSNFHLINLWQKRWCHICHQTVHHMTSKQLVHVLCRLLIGRFRCCETYVMAK